MLGLTCILTVNVIHNTILGLVRLIHKISDTSMWIHFNKTTFENAHSQDLNALEKNVVERVTCADFFVSTALNNREGKSTSRIFNGPPFPQIFLCEPPNTRDRLAHPKGERHLASSMGRIIRIEHFFRMNRR
uniref:Uncharacterized protein n=1 Tax=Photinus pyralis TaxID=7054 RepID=A0A1Y1MT32_PHOPY